jgi:hypothetical protein
MMTMKSINKNIRFLLDRFLAVNKIQGMTIVEILPGHVTARLGIEAWKSFERRMGLDMSAISEFPPNTPDIVYQKKLSVARSIAIHLGVALGSLKDDFFTVKTIGSIDGNDAFIDIIAVKTCSRSTTTG